MTQEQMIRCMFHDMQDMKQDMKELKEDVRTFGFEQEIE